MLDQTVPAKSPISAHVQDLLARRPTAKGTFQGQAFSIKMISVKPRAHLLSFRVMFDDKEGWVGINPAILPSLLKAAGYQSVGLSWSRTTRAIVLKHLVSEYIDALAQHLGLDLRLQPADGHLEPDQDEQVGFAVTSDSLDGRTTIMQLRADDAVMDILGQAILSASPEPRDETPADDAPQQLSIRTPAIAMQLSDFSALSVGDVILTDGKSVVDESAVIWLGTTQAAKAHKAEEGLYQLESDFEEVSPEDERPGPDEALITFEFERRTATEDDVAGADITVSTKASPWVAVLSNGAPFGTGEIVDVDGLKGVRLSRIG